MRWCICFAFPCLLAIMAGRIVLAQGDIDLDLLSRASLKASSWMIDNFKLISKQNAAKNTYNNFMKKGFFTPEKVEPVTEVKNISGRIGDLVGKKMQALKESVLLAEATAATYSYNPNIKNEDVEYINAKKISEDDPRFKYDRMFLQKVVHNESSVHIPTDIFDGARITLNHLNWTKALDDIFKSQLSDTNKFSDTVKYMYFASSEGLLRIFPGMKWRLPENMVDMYDVRRRPWYTQGSSSPKDMLFLIDTSGIMHGQSLSLTKQAVRNLIDTLGENDYVAVAQYPGRALMNEHTAKPHLIVDKGTENSTCFKSFVQATKRNKDRLFQQINGLEAHGIVDFTEAIQFAYEQFAGFYANSTNNQGAFCNSVIMILTDGDVGADVKETLDLINRYKMRNESFFRKIRIFTYSVGQHSNPTDPLRELSCDTRGYFAEIPSMGAVTTQIQHIATVLSRPMTLYEAEYYLWHNIYLDSLGLGLMTSLTMPVYNKTGNQSFLGLIGTDITVKDMKNLVPMHRLGVSGYAFAINANGYIVFHPELKAQRGWLRDPPNVDMIEVEFSNEAKRKVRRNIIARNLHGSDQPLPDKETVSTFLKFTGNTHCGEETRLRLHNHKGHGIRYFCCPTRGRTRVYKDFQQILCQYIS